MPFKKVSQEDLAADNVLAAYLLQATLKPGKTGGVFVATYTVAADSLRQYGIVLPKGGMIIPDEDTSRLNSLLAAVRAKEQEEQRMLAIRKHEQRRAENERQLQSLKELARVSPHLTVSILGNGALVVYLPCDKVNPLCIGGFDRVKLFLEHENSIWQNRETLMEPVRQLQARLAEHCFHGIIGLYYDAQFGTFQESKYYNGLANSWSFRLKSRPPHRDKEDEELNFDWTEENVQRCEEFVNKWISWMKSRGAELAQSGGKLNTKKEWDSSSRHSLWDNKVVSEGSSSWGTAYFIGDTEITYMEYKWLAKFNADLL